MLAPPQQKPKKKGVERFFTPILSGATLRERLIACLGALLAIASTALISKLILTPGPGLPLIVAPLGASAVLLFAIPASPMAQPWAIIGGNTISAIVGVITARVFPDQILAIGFGVSLAILAMSFTRSLHPPGGAAALTAIIGGPAVTNAGFLFPFAPVALNCLILVGLGVAFHRIARRRYPHVPDIAASAHGTSDVKPSVRVGFRGEDIDRALETFNETFDISRPDLDLLLREIELQALVRTRGSITCADVMSRDVIKISSIEDTERARLLLLNHDIRTLPVTDPRHDRLVGTIGLRELTGDASSVGAGMSPAITCSAETSVVALIPSLTDGKTHAVVVVDAQHKVIGIVTQTDLLAALARLVPTAA